MTLWRRAPRAVYRVYGEDEYLAGEETPAYEQVSQFFVGEEPAAGLEETDRDGADADAHRETVVSPLRGSRSQRLVGLGLLVGVTASAFALVALHMLRQRPSPPRSGVAQAAGVSGAPPPASSGSPRMRSTRGASSKPHVLTGRGWRLHPRIVFSTAPSSTTEPPFDGEFGFER